MTNFVEKARNGRINALSRQTNGCDVHSFTPRVRSQNGHTPVFFSTTRRKMGGDTFLG